MHDDPTDLRSQARASQKSQLELKVERDKEIEDFKLLMGSAWGRRVVFRLLERAGIYRLSFTSNGAYTSFNEGQRNIGLYFIDLINTHCLDEFVLMLKEQEVK